MEFHQIRYFLTTAETLNFTRAAERCNVSQPALTRAVKKLEEELGGALFRRERNRTHLTDLGHVMKEHLGRVNTTTQDAVLAANKLLNLEKSPLKVGIMCTIGSLRTIPFLSRFQMIHPGIDLTIYDVTPQNLNEGLLSGNLDCALLGLPTELEDRFDTVRLYQERMVAIFPPDHRFSAMTEIPIGELANERYLDRLNCEFRNSFFELLRKRDIEVSVWYRSEREDWLQNMVLQGMGISIIPEYAISVEGVQNRPITDPDIMRNVELVTVSGRHRSPAVQAFVDEATKYSWLV